MRDERVRATAIAKEARHRGKAAAVLSVLIGGALSSLAGPALATSITGWNTDNVVVPTGPFTPDVTYFSTVYDRDVTGGTAGAITNGRIAFTPPEATAPGLTVQTAPATTGNCILASSGTTCDGPFQSGKRFKQQATNKGAIDLVFDMENDDNTAPYRVFHRLVNLTGQDIGSFSVELGFGVGDQFRRSTAGDGLAFGFGDGTFGANDTLVPFTQFPFGLFGDASTNPNFDIDGFFAAERTGFDLAITEDIILSDDFYGPYEELFGDWLSQGDVPLGYFWDNDGDPATDAILMAWINGDGDIEQRREEDGSDPSTIAPIIVDPSAVAGYELLPIEDLANLNLNYLIFFGENVDFDNFTLRVTTTPVSEPMTLAMFGIGLAGLGMARRRRRA